MNKTNLLVDMGIFTAFLIAMVPSLSGIAVHEWLSLALAGTLVAHLVLHWQWIVGIGARFFKKLWHTSRLKFVVDSLLFVVFVTIMLSGMMISKSILPSLGISLGQTNMTWRMLHSSAASMGGLLVGLHYALNFGWVMSMVKRVLVQPLARLIRPSRTAQPAPVSTDERL